MIHRLTGLNKLLRDLLTASIVDAGAGTYGNGHQVLQIIYWCRCQQVGPYLETAGE